MNGLDLKFAIAPMMEWTDRHCRFFHRLLTRRALIYTEMITTGAVLHGDRARLLAYDAAEHPVALQLAQTETDMEAKETGLAIVYAALGKPDKAKQAVERLMRIPTGSEYNIAMVYAYQGEKDLAFRHLEAACQKREPLLLNLKTDPLLANLRNDPRYHELVRKMNLPESP